MTQLHSEMTWRHNTVKLAVVFWEDHRPRAASGNLLFPCYIAVLDGLDPERIFHYLNHFNKFDK